MAIDAVAEGEMASLRFRPEHVVLNADYAAENRFELPVERSIYLGDTAKVVLRLAADAEVLAKVPAADLAGIERGQVVTASWRASHCLAFRTEDPPAA